MPDELEENSCISGRDLFDDSDAYVNEIYDLGDRVARVVKTDIARAFVDLNRSLQDMPPRNPDGLIKSATCYNKPIYHRGRIPDESLRSILIERYYYPYHRMIQKSCRELDLQLCLDCHSMAAIAPNVSPDGNNKKRPTFCISNQEGKTSSEEMVNLLAECISKSFEIDKSEIFINDPFKGGHITRTYGNNPIPWIQIEMNRRLYLSEPWFDEENLTVDSKRLSALNRKFEYTLDIFFKNIAER